MFSFRDIRGYRFRSLVGIYASKHRSFPPRTRKDSASNIYHRQTRYVSDNLADLVHQKFFLFAFIGSIRAYRIVRNLFKLWRCVFTSPRAQLRCRSLSTFGLCIQTQYNASKASILRRNGITARRADAKRTFIVGLRIPRYVAVERAVQP